MKINTTSYVNQDIKTHLGPKAQASMELATKRPPAAVITFGGFRWGLQPQTAGITLHHSTKALLKEEGGTRPGGRSTR